MINSGNRFDSGSVSLSGKFSDQQGMDVSSIVAVVIAQITSEIIAAEQSVTLRNAGKTLFRVFLTMHYLKISNVQGQKKSLPLSLLCVIENS